MIRTASLVLPLMRNKFQESGYFEVFASDVNQGISIYHVQIKIAGSYV
jgi:hypothetical protein